MFWNRKGLISHLFLETYALDSLPAGPAGLQFQHLRSLWLAQTTVMDSLSMLRDLFAFMNTDRKSRVSMSLVNHHANWKDHFFPSNIIEVTSCKSMRDRNHVLEINIHDSWRHEINRIVRMKRTSWGPQSQNFVSLKKLGKMHVASIRFRFP